MKKNKIEKRFMVYAIGLSIICVFLSVVELFNSKSSYMKQYEKNMEMYLDTLLVNGSYMAAESELPFTEGLIRSIELEFPTSSKTFCMVGKDNAILFLRDKTKTAELFDVTVAEYLGQEADGEKSRIYTTENEFQDGDRYLVTRVDLEDESGVVTVAICTQIKYLLASSNYNMLLQHILLYVGLLGVAFIICAVVLSMRMRENVDRQGALSAQLSKDRAIIDRMTKRIESREHRDVMGGEGSFYSKSVIEQVVGSLSIKQKRKSRQILVHINKNNQVMAVRLAVLIEHLLNGIGIFCLSKEDEYQIILLNADNEAIENVAKQLVVQYKNMFQEDLEDVHIKIAEL